MYYTSRFSYTGHLLAEQIPDPVVITGPDIEPVTVDELKRHLRIADHNDADEDDDLEVLITAGRQFVEKETGLALIDTTYELRFGSYPMSRAIRLRGPLLSVTSFQYTDSALALQTIATTDYIVEAAVGNVAPRIVPAYGVTWPATYGQSDSLRVRWRAGFANRTGSPVDTAAVVPAILRNAIKLHAEAHYDRDEKMMEPLLKAACSLCSHYRVDFGVA